MASSVYLSLNERPRVILDVMRRMQAEALDANRSWNWGCAAVPALAALGVPFFLVDLVMGFNLCTFSLVAGLLWAAAAGMAVYLMIGGRARLEKKQFAAAETVISTLRDDVARKGRMTGWLDLTGPRQKSKIVRTARSRSGNSKIYYRDPWFQFKSRLADGNVLSIAFVDQLKVKKGYIADRRMKVKAKIIVDEKAYRITPFTAQDQQGLLDMLVTVNGGVIEMSGSLSPATSDPQHVLNALKAVYAHLQPAGYAGYAGAGASVAPPEAPTPPASGS